MARTPLYPRGKDLTFWAQSLTQRYERDFSFLRPKTGSASLSSGVSTHVVTDKNMLPTSHVHWTATSANAQSLEAEGMYLLAKDAGQFTIQSIVAAGPGCTFDYVILPQPE